MQRYRIVNYKISDTRTSQDIVMLGRSLFKNRMHAFVAQTQQLYGLIRKGPPGISTRRGPGRAGTSAMPSNPLIGGFADVHDRAEELAKMNAEFGVSRFGRKELPRHKTLEDI